MDSKEQLLNGLKQIIQISSAGIKKLGELVSALTKFLNAKSDTTTTDTAKNLFKKYKYS